MGSFVAGKISAIRWLAWFFAFVFFTVVLAGHIPGLTDVHGRICGLYSVTYIIDAGHFLAGVLAGVAAWHSTRWSIYYFRFIAIPFGIDALLGIFFSRDLLETGSVFWAGFGTADFDTLNVLKNTPHIILSCAALWIGYGLARKYKADR
jgi:hypothetical protein